MNQKTNWLLTFAWTVGVISTCGAGTYTTNTVEGLSFLIGKYNGNDHTIELEPGDYRLSGTGTYTHPKTGPSHIYLNKLHIKGLGSTPDDTRLIGDGTLPVFRMADGGLVENLTVTNGHAVKDASYETSGRGGATYGGTFTNCVFVGNRSDEYGGVASEATFYCCRLVRNSAAMGGAFHSSSAYGCVIAENTSTGNGGGIFTAKDVRDCTIISNKSTGASSYGGGIYIVQSVSNCLIACNQAAKGGGVSAQSETNAGLYRDCVISNNVATSEGGGTYWGCQENCQIVDNSAPQSAGSYVPFKMKGCVVSGNVAAGYYGGINGGSVYDTLISGNVARNGDAGGVYNAVVSNCTVCGNIATNSAGHCYGGGIKSGTIYDSKIFGNSGLGAGGKVGAAGGVFMATLYDCQVHDNYSDTYGGGLRECTAVRCRLSNNVSGGEGANARDSKLTDCDVSGTGVHGGSALRTRFHDIGPAVTLVGNPSFSNAYAPSMVWSGYPNATNCLFCGIHMASGSIMFQGVVAASKSSHLVNCTVASNCVGTMFSCCNKSAYPMTVCNCLFFGNSRTNAVQGLMAADIFVDGQVSAEGLHFSKTAYGATAYMSNFADYVTDEVYKFGAADGVGTVVAETPRFSLDKDANDPYSLQRSSKVRGLGDYQGWMANANDIRGDGFPRSDAGKVDLGCYQCWLPAPGMVLFVR